MTRRVSSDDRKVIEARLQELCDLRGGRLTPEAVVEDAKNPDSPLHGEFDWDVEKAAHNHWLDVARNLIGSVVLVVRTEKLVLRAPYYVRDPDCASHEQGYRQTASLRNDEDAARKTVLDEFQRVAGALDRARRVAAVLGLEAQLSELSHRVVQLRSEVLDHPPAVQ